MADGKGEVNITGRSINNKTLDFNRTYLLEYTSLSESNIEIKVTEVIKHPLDKIDDDFFKKNIFAYEVGSMSNIRIHTMKNGYVLYEKLSPVGICVEKERK
ncbi:hypothetical protein RBG07_00150 [Klebsiella aerogenes]|uniref:hypothetical protein n=1 Tax=Klebsiella aerogenes TaxID=548 RepID=UPI0028DF1355|nr:hypothetical protein [Klebsiella aerogenes]MDT8880971.1 hypothetical protein [Klebsiella aerogenes]